MLVGTAKEVSAGAGDHPVLPHCHGDPAVADRQGRFWVSSNSTLVTAAARANAQPTRVTAPECLRAALVKRISKRLRTVPWAPASHPRSRQSGTPS